MAISKVAKGAPHHRMHRRDLDERSKGLLHRGEGRIQSPHIDGIRNERTIRITPIYQCRNNMGWGFVVSDLFQLLGRGPVQGEEPSGHSIHKVLLESFYGSLSNGSIKGQMFHTKTLVSARRIEKMGEKVVSLSRGQRRFRMRVSCRIEKVEGIPLRPKHPLRPFPHADVANGLRHGKEENK